MMEWKDRTVIHKILDRHALEAGKEILFSLMFRADIYAVKYAASIDRRNGTKKETLREFTRARLNFEKLPDDVTIEAVEEYFADELKEAHAKYLEFLGGSDEADEQA